MNEIEQRFFRTFEIEPIKRCFNCDCAVKDEIGYDNKICDDRCVYIEREYPEITDMILIDLIRIWNNWGYFIGKYKTIYDFKKYILTSLVNLEQSIMSNLTRKKFIAEVQALFREAE